MKKEKRKLIGNIFLLILAVILIVTMVVLLGKYKQNNQEPEEEVELKDVGYNTTIEHVGYKDAKGISDRIIELKK